MRKDSPAAPDLPTGPRSRWPGLSPALTAVALVLVGYSVATPASAQDGPSICLPPNPQGHPIFGTPAVRVDIEGMGATAIHAALGDLNGDGLLDAAIAVGPATNSHISVCFNRGGGVFGPPTVYSAGTEACAVEMGDFNHDGRLDLAVANASGNSISILSNRGDGTFAPAVSYAVGNQPRSLKVGDLNHDGFPDIAVLNCLSNDVSILINRGDGTFFPEVRVAVGSVTQRGDPNLTFAYPGPFLALGDFNLDQALDIAVPCGGRIKLLLNDGAGHFTLAPVSPAVNGFNAYCIAVADLNHDAKPDMAVAVTGSGAAILMGRGDGTFDPAVLYDVRPYDWNNFPFTIHVDAGDLEGNGSPDLAFGHEISGDRITVLRNRGDGTFQPKEIVNSDNQTYFVALRDLRNTGRCDLLSLNKLVRSPLRVNLNDGAGQLLGYSLSPDPIEPADSYGDGALGDIDGDGEPDFAASVLNKQYQLKVFRGLGGGAFAPQSTISIGFYGQASGDGVTIADVNGDGRQDVVLADPIEPGGFTRPGKVWVLINTGGFTFAPPVAYPLDGVTPKSVVAADLNHDGHPDLVVWTTQVFPGDDITPVQRRIAVLMNRGDGTFLPAISYPIWSAHWGPYGTAIVADLDHDGILDIVGLAGTRNEMGGLITLHGLGDGTFAPWTTLSVGPLPVSVVAADLRGQGRLDLAVMHNRDIPTPAPLPQQYLTVLFNDGEGGFPVRGEYTDLQIITGSDIGGRLAVTDVNGDGHLDLILHELSVMTAPVLFNRGDGTFDPPVSYAVCGSLYGNWPAAVFAADLNHDGRPDLLTLCGANFLSFLPNLSCPFCYANCDGSTTPPVLTIADFTCFLNRFASGDPSANCDGSTRAPTLNVLDFMCFLKEFAAGCP